MLGSRRFAMTDKTPAAFSPVTIFPCPRLSETLDENGWNQLGIGFQELMQRRDSMEPSFTLRTARSAGGWTIPSSEIINGHQIDLNYFDLNVGLLYNGSTDGNNNFYFGASHIILPAKDLLPEIRFTFYILALPERRLFISVIY